MTLGCGGFGGNITSDNISPRHLLNIKRLAYGIREVGTSEPVSSPQPVAPAQASQPGAAPPAASLVPDLPRAPSKPSPEPVSAEALSSRIDQFLASRGVAKPGGAPSLSPSPAPGVAKSPATAAPPATPVTFVCEDDVRMARREGRTILVNERTIITPAARDLGEEHRVFVWEGWRS